ncbi:MAG: 4'-phosphopantetheinyl transferase superfamily protein [Bacteroidales bacterium]|nr:4'-phosphopantetheinyl transferase superfamily protein [Bacteroidales bacterium]
MVRIVSAHVPLIGDQAAHGLLFGISRHIEAALHGGQIALHDKEIGIDIENTRKCNLNLAKRYFHQEEYNYLSSLPKEEQDEAFTRIWTLKEAFVKCTGEGIAGGFNKFSVIEQSKFFDNKHTLYYNKEHCLSICKIE